MYDITDLAKDIYSFKENESILKPDYAAVVDGFKDTDILLDNINVEIFGGDATGGFAFIGLQSDIDIIQSLSEEYMNKRKTGVGGREDFVFYMRWNVGENSLFMLYEDYDYSELGFPEQDNVFSVDFGAWTNDDDLPLVLSNIEYWGRNYKVGSEKFNMEKHESFYKKACEVVSAVSGKNIPEEY